TLNGDPYIHFSHYLPRNVNLPEDKNEVQSSLYSLMYQQGFKFSHFKDEFGVATPNQDILTALHLKKEQALLQRMRYTLDLDDQLIECSVAYYHSEMHKYVVNFTMGYLAQSFIEMRCFFTFIIINLDMKKLVLSSKQCD